VLLAPPLSAALPDKNVSCVLSANSPVPREAEPDEIDFREQVLALPKEYRRDRQVHFVNLACQKILAND
jgi:hypothetical protein